ncbi:hypothetical protein F4780DRAFT_380010 [Xylariomycetidae sp. FL0641]|nr:hypothetical protein F4780DRAFT_380010 [Xylariomycetidae sp. FL0641]
MAEQLHGSLQTPKLEEPRGSPTQTPAPLLPDADDHSTINDADSDTYSTTTIPDRNVLGWKNLRVRGPSTTTIYEAWEVIHVRPTLELRSLTQLLGVLPLRREYAAARDGYAGVRAAPAYTQGELAALAAPPRRFGGGTSYARDDLARRVAALPGCLPAKLGALLDARFVATNKCAHARREWRVVALRRVGGCLTDDDEAGSGGGGGRRRRWWWLRCPWAGGGGGARDDDPVRKWLVVLRGQEVRTSREGFEAFDTFANPWLKVDRRLEEMGRRREEEEEEEEERAGRKMLR